MIARGQPRLGIRPLFLSGEYSAFERLEGEVVDGLNSGCIPIANNGAVLKLTGGVNSVSFSCAFDQVPP
jgi:hypothetical protein